MYDEGLKRRKKVSWLAKEENDKGISFWSTIDELFFKILSSHFLIFLKFVNTKSSEINVYDVNFVSKGGIVLSPKM